MSRFRRMFFIEGVPKPGGSKSVFPNKARPGKFLVVDACKSNKKWREAVAAQVRMTYKGDPLECALRVDFTFLLPRPKSHFTSKGILRKSAPPLPIYKPDKGKLERSTTDALTGILWKDDALIVDGRTVKDYAGESGPGCAIIVEEIVDSL